VLTIPDTSKQIDRNNYNTENQSMEPQSFEKLLFFKKMSGDSGKSSQELVIFFLGAKTGSKAPLQKHRRLVSPSFCHHFIIHPLCPGCHNPLLHTSVAHVT
jgi:hypothetical protein